MLHNMFEAQSDILVRRHHVDLAGVAAAICRVR